MASGINLNVKASEIDSAVLDHKNSTIAASRSSVNTTGFTDTSLTNLQLVASKVDSNNTSLNTLNNQYELLQYYNTIEADTSGTVEIPTGYTIELNRFSQEIDAIITMQDSGGRPYDQASYDVNGNSIITTLNSSGNYVLSGTPATYPICIVYYLKGKRQYRDNIVFNKLLDSVEWASDRKYGQFTLNFGNTSGNDLVTGTILDTNIGPNSIIRFYPVESSTITGDEIMIVKPMFNVTSITPNTSFVVDCVTTDRINGIMNVKYLIEN